nr:DUF1294 domain-containing protein [Bacillus sp. FJAT-49736]
MIGFIIMGTDKNYAKKHKWRIPERTLWKIAIIGGACGTTLGMSVFRHKTQHLNFKWGFPFLAIADLVIFYFLIHI